MAALLRSPPKRPPVVAPIAVVRDVDKVVDQVALEKVEIVVCH